MYQRLKIEISISNAITKTIKKPDQNRTAQLAIRWRQQQLKMVSQSEVIKISRTDFT